MEIKRIQKEYGKGQRSWRVRIAVLKGQGTNSARPTCHVAG